MTQNPPQAGKSTVNYSVSGTLAWFIVVVFSYLVLLAIMAGPQYFGHHIKAGDIAEEDLIAPRKTMVIDEEKTQELCESAKQSVLPVLKRDNAKANILVAKIYAELAVLKRLQEKEILPLIPLSPEEQLSLLELSEQDYNKFNQAVSNKEPAKFSDFDKAKLLKSAYDRIQTLPQTQTQAPAGSSDKNKSKAKKQKAGAKAEAEKKDLPLASHDQFIVKLNKAHSLYAIEKEKNKNLSKNLVLLTASISPQERENILGDLSTTIKRFLFTVSLQPYTERSEWEEQLYEFLPDRMESKLRSRAAEFVVASLSPNVSIDLAATELKVKETVESVKPVMKEIEVGSVIVQKGSPIRADEARTLESLGITKISDPGLSAVLSIALFAAFLLFGLYLYTYEPKLFFSPSAIALICTISIVTFVVAFFIGEQFPQFVPLPATALILSVTYGKRLTGILSALILLFLSVSELLTGPHIAATAAASAMALGPGVRKRKDLMLTSILVGAMQMLGYSSAVLIGGNNAEIAGLSQELPIEMLGGIVSAIAAIGCLPFLESIFGILTPYRVAELAEPDQPLMRQLEENAPGTYQHSLAVANLAEGGARAIGADVNLVHTGAMYHDIGKMVTPRYFIENQLGDKNPHDFIPPEESSAKVLAHVTNGLALARKYGLPKAVQAFIPEHQGTTIMAYFYHKACVRDGSENVDPNSYRYPGPKPQTKESAIVMLADVSEAVTHSMHDPSMEEVEQAISSVFKARWDDGQFSESGLSAEELEKVKRGFVRVWRTLHHDRLKYPSTTTGRMPMVPQAVSSESASTAKSSRLETNNQKATASTESSSTNIHVKTSAEHGSASEWDC